MNIAMSLRSLIGDGAENNPLAYLPFMGGSITASGAEIGPDSAMKIGAYFSALRNIGEDTAALPLQVLQKTDSGRKKQQAHPAYTLLNKRADKRMGAFNFRCGWLMHAPAWGGGYAYIQRAPNGNPIGLHHLHPLWIRGEKIVDGERIFIIAKEPGAEVAVGDNDMLHIYGVGPNGYGGYSLAGLAAETLGLSVQAEKFGASYFANGAIPSVVLKFGKGMNPGSPAVDKAIEEWKLMAGGANALNTRGVRPLFDGMDLTTYGIPPNDSQFIETRQFQVEEIARWARMPLHMIGHLLRSTFNNIEEQNLEYVTYTLQAWLKRAEDEYWAKLLTEEEQDQGYYMEHNVGALLRGNSAAQANYFRIMQNQGNLNVNEVRELLNMNGIGSEGDTYMVPVFIQPIEAAIQKAEAEAMKAGALADQADSAAPKVPPSQGGDNTRDNPKPGAILSPVIEAALRESSTRAMRATADALKRHQGDPAGFNLWRKDFFKNHESYTERKLAPAAKALAGLLGKEASPIMNQFSAFARERTEAQKIMASAPEAPATWANHIDEEAAEILQLIGADHE